VPKPLHEFVRRLAARLLRPGVQPVLDKLEQLDRLERVESALEVLAAATLPREKHREELEFWRWLLRTEEGRSSLDAPPEELFARWQRDRLCELARWLGLAEPGEQLDERLDAWCAAQSAVEIGAGPYPALAAAPRWKRAVAVDPLARGYVEEGLLLAGAETIVYIEASGERIGLPSGCADLVIIENALDHVSSPEAVLAEIRRLLRPEGLLWLLVDLSNFTDHMHPHAFDEARARRLLAQAGFETLRDRVSDHKSHPEAYGEYRALLKKRTPAPPLHIDEARRRAAARSVAD
jgi:SAM-dependent methyltransferase